MVDEATWDGLENYRDSLEHYNVKGSKWYEHRTGKYQNHAKYARGAPRASDGGPLKKRKKDKEQEKAEKEKERAARKEARAKAKEEKEAARKEKRRQDILNNPTKLYKHRNEFTYEEIQQAMQKFKWEKELSGYSKDFIDAGAGFIESVNKSLENGIKVYNNAARIANTIIDKDKDGFRFPLIDTGKDDKNKNQNKGKGGNN